MTVTYSKQLSDEAIRTGLAPFGVAPTARLCEQIKTYLRILLQWTEKIGLTSLRNPQEILTRHFGESMFAAAVVPIGRGRLADVGSGAGFPGLPLKLIRPELELILVEPNGKKSAFLSEITRALELSDVSVLRSGFSNCGIQPESVSFITSRALDPNMAFLAWAHKALAAGGKLVLWTSGETSEQVSPNPAWLWQKSISIPESEKRVLLVGLPRR